MKLRLKRLLVGVLSVLLIGTIAAIPVNAASVDDLSYTISNGAVTITDCNTSASGKMTIPDTIEGYPVTKIGNYAFSDCSALTSVTIPASITSIGTLAFYNCENLKDVYITDLKAWCQINCDSFVSSPMGYATNLYLNGQKLTGELIIPSSVTRIGNGAFYNCSGITSVTIPQGVYSIGEYAFAFSNISNISLPSGLMKIGDNAFHYCKLTNVNIPASVSSIGEGAFDVSYSASPVVLTVNSVYARKYAESNSLNYILVLKSLNINQMPNKTEYCPNEQLDTSGMIISASYENGNSETVSSEDYAVSGFDSQKVGNSTIVVSYKGYETTFDVNVRATHSYNDGENICNFCTYERVISSLEIKSLPQKTEYLLNEEFDSTGLVLKVNYSDGSSKEVDYGYELSGFDSTKEGNCIITVMYDGTELTFDVSVEVMPLVGIVFESPNIQIAMGDTYQSEIIYTPSNATYKDVSWKSLDESIATVNENGVISGASKGTATIQATTENGITAECIVTVVNYKDISTSAEWLSISNRPTGMTYKLVADINVGSRVLNIPSSTDVVIDLNGHEVKGSGNIITNNGNLTIKDSSTGGKIYLYTESTNKTCDLIKNYGTMELAGGTLQIVSSAANQSYAMVDLHGVNNYGTLEIKDGKIFVNTFVESNNTGNYVNGIYNQSGGTVVMTGGEVTVETTTETYLSGNKTYSYIYGIYNESLNDLKILGGTINCIYSCWLMCNTNTVIVHGVQNYVAANVILKDATINVQMGGNATEISGGVCGVYNNSYGNIKIDKTKIDVAADISKNIPVSGVNNSNIGSIIIGSDSTSTVENMQIMTSHATNYDSAIDNVDIGLIEVQRGKLEGYAGVCNLSTGRVELGVNDSRVDLSQLCIEATGAVIVSASQVNIYDGAFIGNLSSTVPIHIPDGYSLVKTSNNGVDEYVLIGKPLEAITLNKSELKIVEGRNATLTVQYTPADTTDDKTVIWSSSDENIATVDSDGNVTAIKPGTAVIGATVGKLTVTCNITVLSDNWVQDSVGWWYRNTDGTYPYNCWKEIDGEWYYFNASGYRVTGWLNLSGTWYYMNPKTGIMLSNEWLDNTYYFHGSGAMATGWVLLNGNYYYFNASGEKVTNQWVGSYYLKSNGVMATNEWVGSYYVDASGAYISSAGWLLVGSDWYYLGVGGVRQTGWLNLSGVWYYLNPSTGIMLSNGWLDNTYYFYGNGAMATGWVLINGDYYYFDASGAKVTNCWIGNYYLKSNGVMATNEWIGQYYVGSDGCWIPGYQNNPSDLYKM